MPSLVPLVPSRSSVSRTQAMLDYHAKRQVRRTDRLWGTLCRQCRGLFPAANTTRSGAQNIGASSDSILQSGALRDMKFRALEVMRDPAAPFIETDRRWAAIGGTQQHRD
jgi:hypothetical protein